MLLGTAGLAYANDKPDEQVDTNERLDGLTITVTAEAPEKRLPLAVTHVDKTALPAASESSLQDWLEAAPGLFALNNDNAAQGPRIAIRGFGSRAAFGVRGIRVLVDGVPMTLPDGQTEVDALDMALLESAQIIRGPSAALFGNAAGGAILLRQRQPQETAYARFDAGTGSHGYRRLRAEVGGNGLLGSYLNTESDGFREHAYTQSDLINASLKQTIGSGELLANISSLDIEALDAGGLTAGQVDANRRAARPQNIQFNAGETIEQQRLSLRWDQSLQDWALRSTGYAGQRDFANRLPFTDGGQVTFERDFTGLGITASKQFGSQQISLGLDAQSQSDERQRFDNNNGQRGAQTLNQQENARAIGISLRDTLLLAPDWQASLGLRYDRLRLDIEDDFLSDGDDSGDRDLDDWSADASLSHWRGQNMLYARIASSFETPTFTELANPNGGGFNPDVDSSRAWNYELGVKGQWQAYDYSAALYRIDVDDELLPFELASQPGRSFYRNAGETRRQGLELSAERRINNHWRLDAQADLSKHSFASGNLQGQRLPGLPDKTLRLGLHYQLQAWQFSTIARHIGRLYADDANTTAVSSYQLLDLQGHWQIRKNLGLSLAVNNLLDEDYNDNIRINAFGSRYFEPAAGRSYRLGLSYRWAAS